MKRSLLSVSAVLAACNSVDDPTTPTVSVQRHVERDSGDCYAMLAGPAPAAELQLDAPCDDPAASATVVGGVDRVRLVVDYGLDVEFAASANPPEPTVAVTIDGHETTGGFDIAAARVIDARAYSLVTLVPPAVTTEDVRIAVKVDDGFEALVADPFAIAAPSVAVEVLECDDDGCELPAAVGFAHVRVEVPGRTGQQVTLRSLVDGVSEGESLGTVTTAPVGDHTEKEAPVAVPIAAPGAIWRVEAQLGSLRALSPPIVLRAPMITSQIACDDPCTIAPGASTTLTVTSPREIRNRQASVSTTANGVAGLNGATLNLTLEDVGAGTVSGKMALTAPDAAGAWQIDVLVAGYAAQTLVVTVQ
jgi:hypothetical protein